MKIAIDISQIIYETGVSEYTRNLVANLLALDSENEYVLYGGSFRRISNLKSQTAKFSGNYKLKTFPIAPTLADFLWNRLHILKIERLLGKVDVLHTSDWSEPPSNAFKVTTVHDLAPFKFPEITHPKILATHKRKLAWVKKETDRIIVPSSATKKDLLDMGFAAEKIKVIPEAPDPVFKLSTKEEMETIQKKYRINGNYLISVGVGGRKNTERLITAFENLKGRNLKLVFVGRGVGFEEKRGIRFLGHVPRLDLPALYSGAEALIYPSLYEGFGLPILEAFVCGTPVVTSNLSSMPEVAGNAAVLVDPGNIGAITGGIEEALKNRKELIKKGFKRAKEFSWKKTAVETLAVYNEARE
jgi:glycosyltransferase involved in cell wall biosynthesis